MKVKSHAKINLALDILGKVPSGYHFVQTIFHEIQLHDTIEIEKIPTGIKIECTNPDVPTDETNTVYKAAKLLNLDHGVRVKITKNIPLKSGFGGGSSNAAAVLKALGQNRSKEELAAIGAQIGMDVPFFIYGGTALGTHFGEKITPLPRVKGLGIELVLNGAAVGTRKAYEGIDLQICGKEIYKTKEMLKAINSKPQNLKKIIENIHNDFQTQEGPPYLTGSGGARFFTSHYLTPDEERV